MKLTFKVSNISEVCSTYRLLICRDIKDLKQQKFVVEAEPSETVSSPAQKPGALQNSYCSVEPNGQAKTMVPLQIGEVKEKISKEKGWETSLQKLIYSGMCRSLLYLLRNVMNVELLNPGFAFRQDSARYQHRRVI